MSANADIIDTLNSQPWLVANSAASTFTYNLPSRMSTTSSLDVSDKLVTSMMAETELSVFGPQWPTELNSQFLATELLARPSNIYVRIKKHT